MQNHKDGLLRYLWRLVYPIGIHFALGQAFVTVALFVTAAYTNSGILPEGMVMLLTGLTGLAAMPILLPFYHRDEAARIQTGKLSFRPAWFPKPLEAILLLLTGAALAQYMNLLVAVLAPYLPASSYSVEMEAATAGQGLVAMILWMGVVAPAAEETVFRLLVFLRLRDRLGLISSALISGILFGVYHGDVLQGVYAALMGFCFAGFLEFTGILSASMLVHMGANIWSVLVNEYQSWFLEKGREALLDGVWFSMMAVVLFSLVFFYGDYRTVRERRV